MLQIVNIRENEIGLVTDNGRLVSVVDAGMHFVWGKKVVEYFDLSKAFKPLMNLKFLLNDKILSSRLLVMDIADNEIGLYFEDGHFIDVLRAGTHCFWKTEINRTFLKADFSNAQIESNIPGYLFENSKLKAYLRTYQVYEGTVGILFIDGKYVNELNAGTYFFWNNEIRVELKIVDLRTQQLEISAQELLTKDKAAIRLTCFIQYSVVDPTKSVTSVKDVEKLLYVSMQLILRGFVGGLTLDELLGKREDASSFLLAELQLKVSEFGLNVKDAGIKDIILPGEVKAILNQVLVAEKKAQANSIMRREETAATRSLLNTAKLMEDNEMLWKLKEMEYVEKIAERIGEITISGSGNAIAQLKEIFVK